jgi:hypothetical protein
MIIPAIQDGHLQQTYCSFNIEPYGKKYFKIFSSETSEDVLINLLKQIKLEAQVSLYRSPDINKSS